MPRNGLRLAPSAAVLARRMALILGVGALLSAATVAAAGPAPAPSARAGEADVPYGPTLPFGLVQFFGQSAILAAGVFAARRWLRVRL